MGVPIESPCRTRVEPREALHDRLTCTECRRIIGFESEEENERTLPKKQQAGNWHVM